ncbi:MAG: hypothetical protein RIA10_01225 [Amphiplicatus sp.]
MNFLLRSVLGVFLICAGCAPGNRHTMRLAPVDADDVLQFSISEGRALNEFYRAGPVAAHLVLTSGAQPRLVVAFPAGNSGVSLWFEDAARAAAWRVSAAPRGVRLTDGKGRTLYGIEFEATLEGPALSVERAVLGNIRSIRGYGYTGETPAQIDTTPTLQGGRVEWRRQRLDDGGGYYLSLEALEGDIEEAEGQVRLIPSGAGLVRLKIAALTGDEPLTPITLDRLLANRAADDPASRNILAFLSYKEKLLAGSWRFLTYFGRDTLLSLKMLMPAASPELIEAGLASVFERLDAQGAVAHEEDLAEFALLRRLETGEAPSTAPIYDYAMVDDDFLLAPLAADYLLKRPEGRARAAAFLQQRTKSDEAYGAALTRNLRFIIDETRAFADAPGWTALIRLKDDKHAGEWRDSEEGLGGGRIPYNVNAVLAPAALRATARLAASGLLDPYLSEERNDLAAAESMAAIWEREAAPLFRVRIENETARAHVAAYAKSLGAPAGDALASLGDEDVVFNAVALDAEGAPIPVLNSDEGFLLAFSDPPPDALVRALDATFRPFPAGLLSPAGLLVANAAYAAPPLQDDFSNSHYHGAVVWSWQQALLASGLARQLQREDITDALRGRLETAERDLWRVIEAGEAVKTSELWSWSIKDGAFVIEPFGQRDGDATESNAAQLWSTVYLAVTPPAPLTD